MHGTYLLLRVALAWSKDPDHRGALRTLLKLCSLNLSWQRQFSSSRVLQRRFWLCSAAADALHLHCRFRHLLSCRCPHPLHSGTHCFQPACVQTAWGQRLPRCHSMRLLHSRQHELMWLRRSQAVKIVVLWQSFPIRQSLAEAFSQ